MHMDYHSPYFFGYLLGLVHLLGIVAALHALFTVRTARGRNRTGDAVVLHPLPHPDPLPDLRCPLVLRLYQGPATGQPEMHVAMANLNWRPWVEEALTARESESYAALRAMPKLGRMPCPPATR